MGAKQCRVRAIHRGHANYNWTEGERVEGNSRKRKRHFPSILGVKKVF